MEIENVIKILDDYCAELNGIIERSSKSSTQGLIHQQSESRMREIVVELLDFINDHIPDSKRHWTTITNYFNSGVKRSNRPSLSSVEGIRGVVNSLKVRVERNPSLLEPSPDEVFIGSQEKFKFVGIDTIANRFHLVVMQLRERHDSRATLDVNDEYDTQDIFHSLLVLYFNDIRAEEWNPSYAGGSSRSDFFLPEINAVIEIKKTRQSMTTRQLGEQLIVDIAKYKQHPQCDRLICFVYDPEGRVANPRGIENDLSNCDGEIDVRTIIVPKHV